jgi:D-galactonate transporter
VTDTTIQTPPPTIASNATYKKIMWRLLPFLLLCFLVAYIDRINIGFAKLQMQSDLGFSDLVYGLGAGIFFIGYSVFEVPSNMILHKVGAQKWIARIMISWGIVSCGFAFVHTEWQFYALRFLLGVAEAGFAPGALLFLTYWFPAARRSRANALLLVGIPTAGIVGAPLSGWIMEGMAGVGGWEGWRWMFAIEAAPAVIAGFLVFIFLPNRPADVKWLTDEEKAAVQADLDADDNARTAHMSLKQFLADRRLWLLTAIYFCIVMGQYAISFWLPSIVKNAGVESPLANGLISAIPFMAAAVAMISFSISADKRRERRFHLIIPMSMGAIALALAPAFSDNLLLSVICLSFAAAGLLSSTPMFWSLPPAFLGGVWAAAGIGAINAIGNVAGFASPYVIGAVVDATGKLSWGLYTITAIVLLGMLLVFRVPKSVNR